MATIKYPRTPAEVAELVSGQGLHLHQHTNDSRFTPQWTLVAEQGRGRPPTCVPGRCFRLALKNVREA